MMQRMLAPLATLIFPLTYIAPTVLVFALLLSFVSSNSTAMNLVVVCAGILCALMIGLVVAASRRLYLLVSLLAAGREYFADGAPAQARALTTLLWWMLVPQLGLVPVCAVIAQVDDAPGFMLCAVLPLVYTTALAILSKVMHAALERGMQLHTELEFTV